MRKVVQIFVMITVAFFAILFFNISYGEVSSGGMDLFIAEAQGQEEPIEIPHDGILRCRCHGDGVCYGGNLISFRKNCAKVHSGEGSCNDYDSHCPNPNL